MLETLNYLAVALPPETSAAARLLAIQCVLRANARSLVHLPAGLLRGMRLHNDPAPWQDLGQAHWLHDLRSSGVWGFRGYEARLLDPAVLPRYGERGQRIRAADWALRNSRPGNARHTGADKRLTALALRSHTAAHAPHGREGQKQMSLVCGVPEQQLPHILDLLVAAGFLASWRRDVHSTNLTWTLTHP